MDRITRCKFICTEVRKNFTREYDTTIGKAGIKPTFSSEFEPVMQGSEENQQFFKWTPAGRLTLNTHNEVAFEPGKEYYLDITKAG